MSYPKKSQIIQSILIGHDELPFSCPPLDKASLLGHPLVYLTFQEGEAVCPYCGAHYILATQQPDY
jgi:uncharacterized Zn-finger protein